MTGTRVAVVAGGGIAGLAAAASLLRHGWVVTVLERASAFTEIGTGLAITTNGLAALDALDLADATRAAGVPVRMAGTRDQHGRWLVRTPDNPATATVGIHRRRLHTLLQEAAGGAELRTCATVTGVDPGGTDGPPARVRWRDPTGAHETTADLVVGADGLRSTVRTVLFPSSRPAYSGSTCWRAIVDVGSRATLSPLWGPGAEFGALPTAADQTYWYLYLRHPCDATFPDEFATARGVVTGWAAEARDLVAATPSDRLMRHDVYHLAPPLPSYVHGRAVLVGDAAHALVPTMGQGANTALEDAVSLGPLLGADLAAGLAVFDRARRPRTQAIARRSRLTGRLGADLQGRWTRALRDSALRVVPATAITAAGTRMLTWQPPAVRP